MDQPMTLTKAMNMHVRLPGETMPDFAAQMKRLDDADRRRYATMFQEQGIAIDPTSIVRPAPIVHDNQV